MKKISDDDVRIGQRLRAARLARRISQTDLGAALGVSFQQIQKYEAGSNRISGTRLISVGTVLGVSVGHLLGEDAHDPVSDDIMTALASPGGPDLAASFNKLTIDQRRLLVNVARAMAGVAT